MGMDLRGSGGPLAGSPSRRTAREPCRARGGSRVHPRPAGSIRRPARPLPRRRPFPRSEGRLLRRRRHRRRGRSSRKVFAPTAPIASDEAEAAGLALYRTAHRLHFIYHDYAGALAAWDDYLRAEPRGRLAVEVRYNRAIALVHLGRNDEARSALQPFALGQIEGGYRQREASALIDALDSRDP